MATAGVSMKPEDYFYCAAPSPEQVAEQQRLLGLLTPKSWQQDEQPTARMPPVQAPPSTPEPPAAGLRHASLFQRGTCVLDDDEVLHDFFGRCAADACPQAPAADLLADRSASDASTSTTHNDDEDCVDLLFSTSGPWREWLGLELHHGMGHHPCGSGGEDDPQEATSQPGVFLKLNHEAAARAINYVLHSPA